jgi:serine-type D-Ala-D-Ala carboxypeptidase (penicillin-binding protein 5/6)
MDATSGQILYQQNGQAKNFPASTTKLLTALVAVEHAKLDQVVTVSPTAVDMPPGSSLCYLEQGEQQKLESLLYGLLLVSGNDCATAIAEGVAGGDANQFVAWMNETAQRIGATHSHFVNPHGLHDQNHFTTAYDLALIGRAALANPTVRKIAGSPEYVWPGKSERNGTYYNHNQMLFTFPGTFGGKNGFTEEAGNTLVTGAERDGRAVIGVVMGENGSPLQYADMTALLDMGLTEFEAQKAVVAGTTYGDVAVTGGTGRGVTAVARADFAVTAPKGGKPNVTLQPKLSGSVTAPVAAAQELGVIEIREGDRLLGTVPLVAEQGVAARSFFSMSKAEPSLLSGVLTGFKWLLGIAVGLVLFRFSVRTVRRIVRRSRKRAAGFGNYAGKGRSGTIDLYRVKDR